MTKLTPEFLSSLLGKFNRGDHLTLEQTNLIKGLLGELIEDSFRWDRLNSTEALHYTCHNCLAELLTLKNQQVLECPSCTHLYTSPPMSKEIKIKDKHLPQQMGVIWFGQSPAGQRMSSLSFYCERCRAVRKKVEPCEHYTQELESFEK